MSFRVECPNCHTKLQASERHFGKRGKCPACGSAVVITPHVSEARTGIEVPPTEVWETLARYVGPVITEKAAPDTGAGWLRRQVRVPLVLAIALISLLVGWFGGREYLKYQMLSALASIGDALFNGVKKSPDASAGEKRAGDGLAARKQGIQPPLGSKPFRMGVEHVAGPLSIMVVQTRIGYAEVKTPFHRQNSKSKEKYLLISLRIRNLDDRKVLRFTDYIVPRGFRLKDDVGNEVRGVTFGHSNEIVGALTNREDIDPKHEAWHLVVFALPLPKTKHLILTVELKSFGGEGKIDFKIPVGEIAGFVPAALLASPLRQPQ